MPIYEFECRTCSRHFEELVRSSGQAVACPQCGSADIRRLVSSFAFASGGCSGCSGGNCSGCKGH